MGKLKTNNQMFQRVIVTEKKRVKLKKENIIIFLKFGFIAFNLEPLSNMYQIPKAIWLEVYS